MDPVGFEVEITCLTTVDELWRRLVVFAGECGVVRIGYHHLPPPGAPDVGEQRIFNEGFSGSMLAQYLDARASGLAVLAQALQNTVRPVYLDDLDAMSAIGPRERAHLAAYRAAGVNSGLGVQAFGPAGRNGIFAIDLATEIRRLDAPTMARLRWACQAMHLRYCEILMREIGEAPNLSMREAEVLTWVAHGKTNASIAEILGISAHTVDAHLRRVYLKLGVADRISAALRGLGFGLINLEPGESAASARSR